MKPVRVLVVHSSAELYGSDRSLLDFVRLRPAGMSVCVAVPEPGPLVAELQAAGAEVKVGEVCKVQREMLSPRGLLLALRKGRESLRFLGALHRTRPFDLVYSNSVAVFGGALMARRRGLPHVWHVREILAGSRALTTVYRTLVRHLSQRVICNSGQTLAWIRGGSADDPRYVAVWNGFGEPAMAAVERSALRRELGALDDADVLFVLVGRVNAWKGQRLLVEAFSALCRQTALPLRLALVGSAFKGQEHFEDELRQAVAASGCTGRIVLQPFRSDIESVWRAADVVVVPSTQPEPFGRVAVEAMAFGKPVIAAAHGGLAEIVAPGETGLLVPPGDAQALQQAMRQLAESAPLRLAFGEAGRQRQRTLFSVEAYARQVGDLLLRAGRGAA